MPAATSAPRCAPGTPTITACGNRMRLSGLYTRPCRSFHEPAPLVAPRLRLARITQRSACAFCSATLLLRSRRVNNTAVRHLHVLYHVHLACKRQNPLPKQVDHAHPPLQRVYHHKAGAAALLTCTACPRARQRHEGTLARQIAAGMPPVVFGASGALQDVHPVGPLETQAWECQFSLLS